MIRGRHFKLDIKRTVLPAFIFAALFSLSYYVGSMLEEEGKLLSWEAGRVFNTVFIFILSCMAMIFVWTWLDARQKKVKKPSFPEPVQRKQDFFLWLLLFAFEIIILLGVYPGFFVYDASQELSMVQSREFTTHHPLLHVLLLGGVILAVHKVTGSYNLGIFVYLLLQAAVITASFVYMLSDLRRRGAGTLYRVLCILWLLLCPTVTMFVLCSCKDSLFAAFLLVMTVEVRCMMTEPEVFFDQKHIFRPINLVVSASLMMLLRNNGVYAYVVFVLLYLVAAFISRIVCFIQKKRNRSCFNEKFLYRLILLVLPLVIYEGVSFGFVRVTDADSSESQEILTVPIMQLARTWNEDRDSFTQEDEQWMDIFMEEDGWDNYRPKLSDPVKVYFDSSAYRSNRNEFWQLWYRQGMAHPKLYLEAFLMTSYGFWYPEAVIDCYEGNIVYTFTYGDSSYFGYETESPGERKSLIKPVDDWFYFLSLNRKAQEIPILHLVLSPGMMFWLFLWMMFTVARTGRTDILISYLPVLLVWLTVQLGPCALPRYVVYLWFGLPLFIFEANPDNVVKVTNGKR